MVLLHTETSEKKEKIKKKLNTYILTIFSIAFLDIKETRRKSQEISHSKKILKKTEKTSRTKENIKHKT